MDVDWGQKGPEHGLKITGTLLADSDVGQNCIFLLKTTSMGSAADFFRRKKPLFLRTVHSLANQDNCQRLRFLSANAEGFPNWSLETPLISQMLLDLQEEALADAARDGKNIKTPADFHEAVNLIEAADYYGCFNSNKDLGKLYKQHILNLYSPSKTGVLQTDVWFSPLNLGAIKRIQAANDKHNKLTTKTSFTRLQKEPDAFLYGLLAYRSLSPLEAFWLSRPPIPEGGELKFEAPKYTDINNKWNLSKFNPPYKLEEPSHKNQKREGTKSIPKNGKHPFPLEFAQMVKLDVIIENLDAIKEILLRFDQKLMENIDLKNWFGMFSPEQLPDFRLSAANATTVKAKSVIFQRLDGAARQLVLFHLAQVEIEILPCQGLTFLECEVPVVDTTEKPEQQGIAAEPECEAAVDDPAEERYRALRSGRINLLRKIRVLANREECLHHFVLAERQLIGPGNISEKIINAFRVDPGCNAALEEMVKLASKQPGEFNALLKKLSVTRMRLGLPPPEQAAKEGTLDNTDGTMMERGYASQDPAMENPVPARGLLSFDYHLNRGNFKVDPQFPDATLLELVVAALAKLNYLVENGLQVLAACLHREHAEEAEMKDITSTLLWLWKERSWGEILHPVGIPESLPEKLRAFWPEKTRGLLEKMAEQNDEAKSLVCSWKDLLEPFKLGLNEDSLTEKPLSYPSEPPGWLCQFTIALPLTWAWLAEVTSNPKKPAPSRKILPRSPSANAPAPLPLADVEVEQALLDRLFEEEPNRIVEIINGVAETHGMNLLLPDLSPKKKPDKAWEEEFKAVWAKLKTRISDTSLYAEIFQELTPKSSGSRPIAKKNNSRNTGKFWNKQN